MWEGGGREGEGVLNIILFSILSIFFAHEKTLGGIFKSHRPSVCLSVPSVCPSVRPSVCPSVTNRVSAITQRPIKEN